MRKCNPKKINTIALVIIFVGALIGFCGIAREIDFLVIIGMIVVISSIIFRLIFYRCPHCSQFLDRSTGEYCPYCGEKINEYKEGL